MASIRPMGRDDIPRVAELYELVMRSGTRTPPPGIVGYFERTLLDHPWADPGLPSLVHESADGRIIGFIGSHVRRLRVGNRHVVARYGGQFLADPGAPLGTGGRLLRAFVGGDQDAALSDGANTETGRMVVGLGGRTAFVNSLAWLRFFRPALLASNVVLPRQGHEHWGAAVRHLAGPLDVFVRKTGGSRYLRVPRPETWTSPLSVEAFLEHLPAVAGDSPVRLDYDEAFLRWLFTELEATSARGLLQKQLVRDRSGTVLGWYIAYFATGRVGEVLQVLAGRREIGAVMDQLFFDAYHSGTAALQGRLEPLLFEVVRERGCLLRHSAGVVVHSRDPQLAEAVLSNERLLTRLDGEWWMVHHLDPFEEEVGPGRGGRRRATRRPPTRR